MDSNFKNFMQSGKKMVGDTKVAKAKETKKQPPKMDSEIGDAHQVFVRRAIQELPKKSDIVEDLQKFCNAAEKNI
jgi:hypothetical protein